MAERKMVQSMKTFKTFFEDNESGNVNIVAKDSQGKEEPLGQTDLKGKKAISSYINKFNQGADNLIAKLVTESGFDTKDYHALFASVINNDKYEVDWSAFKNHVVNRFENYDLGSRFSNTVGEFNMKDEFMPIISKFVKNNQQEFFTEVFQISTKISGTAVGDGEFILGIIGNGVKGKVGDVDVIYTDEDGKGLALEVGTQDKIIGDASRVKGAKGVARKIWEWMLVPIADEVDVDYNPKDLDVWENNEARERAVLPEFKKYSSINDSQAKWIYNLIVSDGLGDTEIDSSTMRPIENNPKSNLNRILGGLIMYDYIKNHKDDVIVSINFGGETQANHEPFHTRYANVNKLGFEGTIKLMLDSGWFNFSHSPDGTRFTIGEGISSESLRALSYVY